MKILVASENPVKIAATEEAFSSYSSPVEVIGKAFSSGVSDQPFGEETLQGAVNRAKAAWKWGRAKGFAYFVGIEGGYFSFAGKWFSAGIICIINKEGKKGLGISSFFPLPEKIIQELEQGKELGSVIDQLANTKNIKHSLGASGWLTDGKISRKDLYVQALHMALIPLRKKELFKDHELE